MPRRVSVVVLAKRFDATTIFDASGHVSQTRNGWVERTDGHEGKVAVPHTHTHSQILDGSAAAPASTILHSASMSASVIHTLFRRVGSLLSFSITHITRTRSMALRLLPWRAPPSTLPHTHTPRFFITRHTLDGSAV